MPLAPDPELARAALAQLDAVRATVAAAEDDVLACLVVTGEPRPQRVLDDWLDQVADTLRALGEAAADLSPSLARHAVDAVPPVVADAVPPVAADRATADRTSAGRDVVGRGSPGTASVDRDVAEPGTEGSRP